MLIKIQFKKKFEKIVMYLYFQCFYYYFNLNVIKRIFDLLFRLSIIVFDIYYYFTIVLSTFDNIDDKEIFR